MVEHIRVTDADLEIKVLRALRKEFNPTAFLDFLKPYHKTTVKSQVQLAVTHQPPPPVVPPSDNAAGEKANPPKSAPTTSAYTSVVPPRRHDDIFIDFGADSKDKNKQKPTKKEAKQKPEPAAKEKKGGFFGVKKKEQASKGGFFGGKGKQQPASVVMGAAAEAQVDQTPQQHIDYNQPPINIPYIDDDDGGTVIMEATPAHTGFRIIITAW
jgi:hypothetical protein